MHLIKEKCLSINYRYFRSITLMMRQLILVKMQILLLVSCTTNFRRTDFKSDLCTCMLTIALGKKKERSMSMGGRTGLVTKFHKRVQQHIYIRIWQQEEDTKSILPV